jgi:hypothetical protein
MAKMSKYMVTHITPDIPWEKVEENWANPLGESGRKLGKTGACGNSFMDTDLL